jgi:hypothetical protein
MIRDESKKKIKKTRQIKRLELSQVNFTNLPNTI